MKKTTKTAGSVRPDDPTRAFKYAKAWESWLAKNHDAADGIWMRMAKKASGIKSITYPEAVEVALCYGWIDGLKRPESPTTWLQRTNSYAIMWRIQTAKQPETRARRIATYIEMLEKGETIH